MTYAELKNFVESCGVRFELNPRMEKTGDIVKNPETGRWEDETYQSGWFFGMNNIAGRSGKSEWQWVWFRCYDEELTDESYFYFEERYSMVNGRAYKGVREWLNAVATIERRMEKANA